MRISVITTMQGAAWGGSEELWASMAERALADGHDVAIWACRWPARCAKLDALAQAGAKIHYQPLRRWRRAARLFYSAFPPAAALRRFRPDVVCLSEGAAFETVRFRDSRRTLSALQAMGVPLVVVSQFIDERELPGGVDRGAAAAFLASAAKVVFVADRNRRAAERQLARPLHNAVVVQNPVNAAIASLPWPQAHGDPAQAVARLACVARLKVQAKGQDVLLEALSAPRWRDRPWELRLYGTGPDKAYLESLAARYRLNARVWFEGHVTDLGAIWSRNEMLVLPSHNEGTPLSLLEAMMHGRPAVVTDVGGNAEWVGEGESGFIATAPTASALGDALARAWQRRDDWPEMGRRAREVAQAKLDPAPGRTLLDLVVGAATKRAVGPLRSPPAEEPTGADSPAAAAGRPALTVVIPTYLREHVLLDTVEQVLAQRGPGDEVLVMDQTPEHEQHVSETLARWHASGRIAWHRLRRPSLPAARNEALRLARGEVVVFIDDDVILAPGFLQGHLANYADPRVVAVAGRTTQDTGWGTPPPQPWDHLFDYKFFQLNGDRRVEGIARFTGANHSVRKATVLGLGGYDEQFIATSWGEESDLAIRIWQSGGLIVFDPAASLHHLREPSGGCRKLDRRVVPAVWMQSFSPCYFVVRHLRGRAEFWRNVCLVFPRRFVLTKPNVLNPWRLPWAAASYLFSLSRAFRVARKNRRLKPRRAAGTHAAATA